MNYLPPKGARNGRLRINFVDRPKPRGRYDLAALEDDSAGGTCWLKRWQLPPAFPAKDEAPIDGPKDPTEPPSPLRPGPVQSGRSLAAHGRLRSPQQGPA